MRTAVTFAAIGQLHKLAARACLRAVSTTSNKSVPGKEFESSEPYVSATPVPLRPNKESARWDSTTSSRNRRKHFVDWMKVRVKAGNGGDGRVNLMHRYRIDHAGLKLQIS